MSDWRILVIVVTYNGAKYIENCLAPLQSSGDNIETIVVDNGSTDATADIVKRCFPKVIVVEAKKNLGFGAANNVGFRYALANGFDYVYLLNQDAWIAPEDIERLARINAARPEFGIISPLQVYRDKTRLDLNFSKTLPRELINDCVLNTAGESDVYATDNRMVQAAHWLIGCEVLRKVGGFSPAFFHYGEDHNLCHRVWYWGYKVGIVPSVRGVHDREARVDSEAKKIYLISQQWKYFISNPNLTNKRGLLLAGRSMFSSLLAYKFKIVKPVFSFFGELRGVLRTKRASRSQGAFLNDCVQ